MVVPRRAAPRPMSGTSMSAAGDQRRADACIITSTGNAGQHPHSTGRRGTAYRTLTYALSHAARARSCSPTTTSTKATWRARDHPIPPRRKQGIVCDAWRREATLKAATDDGIVRRRRAILGTPEHGVSGCIIGHASVAAAIACSWARRKPARPLRQLRGEQLQQHRHPDLAGRLQPPSGELKLGHGHQRRSAINRLHEQHPSR